MKQPDANFEGPSLFPSDPIKKEFAEELIKYVDTFTKDVFGSFKGDPITQTRASFDYVENALGKFDDGPFFLGEFSLADISYIPFIERFQIVFSEVFKYDITFGRPKLAAWIENLNNKDAYKQTVPIKDEELYSMAAAGVRIPPLTSTSEPPPLFDGTTRLYTSYTSPYAQRVWIVMNYKGLQDHIELVPIDLRDMPAWYKEKVYPGNKVPSLEHNGKVLGESLDLIKYVDANFEGPSLVPSDPARRELGEQLISLIDPLMKDFYASFKREDPMQQAGASFDYLENALGKFDDGPFFLGQFSLVDAAYAPFVERLQITFSEVYKNDITAGRPKLATYIEELNKVDAYKQTKVEPPQEFVEVFKKWLLAHSSKSI
ncbi:unnamed protein product [Sphenostylis stenocarpa]|uniref:glutathione transferase n=1 Tax=Sphenostylis stenocarpa TaxID=92480 RepID=A0AA86RU27_9FABA|nr:unnamed protein product [Sphenostylis stenocarpa]